MYKISIELNENQHKILKFLLELQDNELDEDEFKNLVFISGLLLLFEKLASEQILNEESSRTKTN